MELTEFYSKLAELEGGWQGLTNLTHCIRRHKNGEGSWCPITAVVESVTGKHYPMWEWGRAANEIYLEIEDAQGIVDAADNNITTMKEEIRKQLLKATGLEEWDAAWKRGETTT